MKKFILIASMTLIACQQAGVPSDATEGEISMAEMMGISVEELRNQTPEEHMQMMMEAVAKEAEDGFLPGMDVDIATLPEAKPTETMEVEDGDVIVINPMLVRKTIGEKSFAMYGYNGQIPGPLIKAKQGSSITVNVENKIDMPTTIHWHGLRHDSKDDGVPDLTQPAIEPGGTYKYTLKFPDEGIYWYHPHVREDIQQDMGLYGNILVQSEDASYAAVDREEVIVLDDLMLDDDGSPTPYGKDDADHALMGRFGNIFLVNGKPVPTTADDLETFFTVDAGTHVRFYITNVANTQTFRLNFGSVMALASAVTRHRMKLVGSDLGRYEREEWIEEIVIAPAERAIVEVFFDDAETTYDLTHVGSTKSSPIARFTTTDAAPKLREPDALLTHQDVIADVDTFRAEFDRPVDKTLRLSVEMNMNHEMMMAEEHNDDGIEWEDTMPEMNAMSNKENTQWKLIDEEAGKENMDIDWSFEKGSVAKIRIVNDEDSDHPMQHPIHFHGQRFLVLSMDGEKNENFVWKDTVLIPTGSTVDLLFDMSNPGDWMFHCHIAEHLTNGMMGMLKVKD